ncbi:MAG: NusG domain II-containing protein, partial [Desulfuromonadales bacterium]|nr:NusG domain II-containing protein [Desulfuromonadales bacterium]
RLEIENGTARIVDSPCPYKVCISMGEISRRGEIIACVPNRLLVQVAGVEPD